MTLTNSRCYTSNSRVNYIHGLFLVLLSLSQIHVMET